MAIYIISLLLHGELSCVLFLFLRNYSKKVRYKNFGRAFRLAAADVKWSKL